MRYLKYLMVAIKVLKELQAAAKDGKITVKEVWGIIETLLESLGIDVVDREIIKL